ncbi:MAG: flavodoxin-dependent (E)-4-hydroxy-3-methylbut-2-enyl-diphosphate synthase [Bacillota bacterium]
MSEPFERRNTRQVRCGSVAIGGGAPISIQTMTKTDTRNPGATVDQVNRAVDAGAEIVRVAVPDMEAAQALAQIVKAARCPVVADIHFDYRLAIASIEAGAAKVRINPGNLGSADKLLAVAASAKERGAAIRVGVNGGSVDKDLLEKYGGPTPKALVESAVRSLDLLSSKGCGDIVISLKSSSVRDTVEAYSLMARETDWPFHIGITEAGPGITGVVKSAAGISALLALGLGDTVRVSLTGDPVEEVQAAKEILQAAGARRFRVELISCPTCGRTQVDLIPIAKEIERRLLGLDVPIRIAVMGCPVNGPGEAREADAGVACGRDGGILFSHGKVLGRVKQEEIVESLMRLVQEEADRFRRGSSVAHNR